MTRKRFDSAPHINVKDEGLLLQQVAGSTANLLEVKAHNGSTLMAVDYSGTMTSGASNSFTYLAATTSASLPANTTIGNVSPTELGYLDGVTSALQTQLNSKLSTAVTSLTGTANQVTVSASTGSVTLSLPQNIHTGATPTFAGLTSSGNVNYTSSNLVWMGGGVWDEDGNWSGIGSPGGQRILMRHSTSTNLYVIARSGNVILRSTAGGNDYTFSNGSFDTGGRSIILGSHTLSSDTWRFRVTPNNYTSYYVELGEYYSRPTVRAAGGSLYLVGSGNVQIGIETNNRLAYFDTNGLYLEQGWVRPHGQAGIYFQSYGGGWWMTDTTWIRAYGDKNVYTAGEIRSNQPFSSNNTNNGANLRMISSNITYFGWYGYYAQFVDSTHVKTFVIDHPTKPDNYLVHACAEGPTSDVFYRGEGQLQNGICVVTLPDYFEELTEKHGRTVMITPIADENGPAANLAAYEIEDGQFVVEQIGGFHVPFQRFWWRVDAIRKGTTFEVEPTKSSTEVYGDGPYTYARRKA